MSEKQLLEYMSQYFIYRVDGTFLRLDRKNANGTYDKDGYLIMKVKGKNYKAHRLVYLFHYGRMPKENIDHINRVRDDNRIENLRECSQLENVRNTFRKRNSVTGVIGVHFDTVTKGLKKRYTTKLGNKTYRFNTIEEAVQKRREYYGNNELFFYENEEVVI